MELQVSALKTAVLGGRPAQGTEVMDHLCLYDEGGVLAGLQSPGQGRR